MIDFQESEHEGWFYLSYYRSMRFTEGDLGSGRGSDLLLHG